VTQAATPPAVGTPDGSSPPDRSELTRRRYRWLGVAAALAVVLVAVLLWRAADSGPAALTRADVERQVQQRLEQAERDRRAAPPEAATAYQTILPSLVTVTSEGKTEAAQGTVSMGAGVVVNADGSILTALHVVDGAQRVRVRFADGTQSNATVTARQPASDIAVLSVDQQPSVIVPAVLGGAAAVGDAVFAVGNPLGLAQSISAGVVSALGRSVKVGENRSLEGLIQFDAAVNPGNSGGPLLNRDGQVVGIVTGLANPAEQAFFVGIGFAVPIATAGGAAGGPPQ
jgi:S1-C subfamily serine protease